jgi:acetoin utilization deacetylase AcuC-like enzyme
VSTKTGFVWDERFAWHDVGSGAGPLFAGGWIEPGELPAENAATKRRIRNLLDASGLLKELTPLTVIGADERTLALVHDREYIERVRSLSEGEGGSVGTDTRVGRGSFEIASLSVGGAIAATTAVMQGQVRNAYALVRPPGHHATASEGAGFCVFANVAIAVLHARSEYPLARVAIVDWDAHHGNGTQSVFYDDPSVLTISLHQDGVFPPESGTIHEVGAGAGTGYAINVPLPPGSGSGAYRAAFDRIVLPALERFAPELIVVSSGFDANNFDPLSRQLLGPEDYRWMTSELMSVAERFAGGRLVLSHEGGYHAGVVPFCGLAVIEQLSGYRTCVEDPFTPLIASSPWQALQPHQEASIERARQAAPLLS